MSVADATSPGNMWPVHNERRALCCRIRHGCRSDELHPEQFGLTIHRSILSVCDDIESAGAEVTPDTIIHTLTLAHGSDNGEAQAALSQILAEPADPLMFDVYARQVIQHAERQRLQRHFEDGLILCNSRASVAELQEHAALAAQRDEKPDEIRFVSGPELAQMDTTITYLVEDMIVQSQPLLLCGPKKSLKTNIAIDLNLSLATGTPFLRTYSVKRPVRAGLMSAESGAATIKETAHRVAISRGFDGVQDCPNALFAFETPLVSNAKECDRFRRLIEDNGLEFLNVDPTYLTFAIGDDGKNLFRMGELLAPLSRIVQRTGCTIALSHHAKKGTGREGQPLDLGDESYSGFSEWCRQWLYLSRRESYDETRTGSHKLWLRWGGSAGHSGLIGLNIEEGSRKDQWGRIWDVRTVDPGEIVQERLAEDDSRKQAKTEATFTRHIEKTREALRAFPNGATLTDLSAKAATSKDRCREAVFELQDLGEAEPCTVVKGSRHFEGWRPTGIAG